MKIDFANRSDAQMSIGLNALDVYYGGKILAQSMPSATIVTIAPNSISTLKGISISIPIMNMVSVIGSEVSAIIANFSAGGNITTDFARIINAFDIKGSVMINKTISYVFQTQLGQSSTAVSGLGLVSNEVRKIRPISDYANYLPSKDLLKFDDPIVLDSEDVKDTLKIMHQIASKYQSDTKMLAEMLKGKTLRDTVENIYWFVYEYIKYTEDDIFKEQVRRPLRTLYDQKGDCDCYSVLIASMLNNLGIDYVFRIAAFNGKTDYQHVYVVVPSSSGELICDPVVNEPFYQKPPSKCEDFPKPKGLSGYTGPNLHDYLYNSYFRS
jgi:hypothetical protein